MYSVVKNPNRNDVAICTLSGRTTEHTEDTEVHGKLNLRSVRTRGVRGCTEYELNPEAVGTTRLNSGSTGMTFTVSTHCRFETLRTSLADVNRLGFEVECFHLDRKVIDPEAVV